MALSSKHPNPNQNSNYQAVKGNKMESARILGRSYDAHTFMTDLLTIPFICWPVATPRLATNVVKFVGGRSKAVNNFF